MDLGTVVEEQIRRAQEEGEFDNLPGKGRPIDLTTHFAAPEDRRVGYALLKNAGVLPAEAVLLNEINGLKSRINETADEAERSVLMHQLQMKELDLNISLERTSSHRRTRE